MFQMSVANAILVLSRKERGTMSKMKELFTEQTSIVFDVAECVECGVEIEFATDDEFAELVSSHACIRLV